MNLSGIYMILNLLNGKYYIGSAKHFAQRWAVHQYQLSKGKHHSILLQRSWDKNGPDAFQFIIIERVIEILDLIKIEKIWFDATDCCNPEKGYNIYVEPQSSRGSKRKPISEETRIKIGLANKGKKRLEEFKKQISLRRKGKPTRKGMKPSEETKNKISNSLKGIPHSEKRKINQSWAQIGLKRPNLRKSNKWPHEKGIRCQCEDCREKRNQYYKNYRIVEALSCE